MKLYDIDAAILECVDTETGDILDIDRLEALEMERDRKISDIACWIKTLKAEAKAIKEEKDKLAERQKAAENKMESLKKYLSGYLNGMKFKDARCSIYYHPSISTKLDDNLIPETLPPQYQKVIIEPNITAIKEDLEQGIVIDGCHLVNNTSIVIR